jgi:ribosomal protein S18 acetylase RimI-like enzyme
MLGAMTYTIRPVRADEWREIRLLRLEALQDDLAPIAFLDSFADAQTQPDEFWQVRAARSSSDAGHEAGARQFVAVDGSGSWVGTLVVIVEKAGEVDFEGKTVSEARGHVVGVYLRPEHRGRGVLQELFEAALGWIRERGLPQARLHVHADNIRARKAYEKAGFRATGNGFRGAAGNEIEMARRL